MTTGGVTGTGSTSSGRLGTTTARTGKKRDLLAFPANLAQRWMPGLFPERPNQ